MNNIQKALEEIKNKQLEKENNNHKQIIKNYHNQINSLTVENMELREKLDKTNESYDNFINETNAELESLRYLLSEKEKECEEIIVLKSTIEDFKKEKAEIIDKVFKIIKKECNQKMDVVGNIECGRNRKLYSGLGQCLCEVDNCYKIRKV
jgi:chromosome segregation ATPase